MQLQVTILMSEQQFMLLVEAQQFRCGFVHS